MGLGVVRTSGVVPFNASRMEHAGLTKLIMEGSGASNLLGDGVVLVVDVLDTELGKLGGLRLAVNADKVRLELGKEVDELGLVTETDDLLGSVG